MRTPNYILWLAVTASSVVAQTAPVKLTLKDAEALALKHHPQVLAAENEASAMDQRISETKSAYYPVLAGEVTGSQGNPQGRIGAGYLSASRLFNRVGQGITLSQLITDSGRAPNLVASLRLLAGTAQQNYEATRFSVLRIPGEYEDSEPAYPHPERRSVLRRAARKPTTSAA